MRFTALLSISLLYIMVLSCNSDNAAETKEQALGSDNGKAEISFAKTEHDFGRITEGEKVGTVFKFTNTGDGDLLISSVTTSCGCTVPRFVKKPVKPGESGTIEAVFDSSYREGAQSKTLTVRSNAIKKVMVLRITAEVEKSNNQK